MLKASPPRSGSARRLQPRIRWPRLARLPCHACNVLRLGHALHVYVARRCQSPSAGFGCDQTLWGSGSGQGLSRPRSTCSPVPSLPALRLCRYRFGGDQPWPRQPRSSRVRGVPFCFKPGVRGSGSPDAFNPFKDDQARHVYVLPSATASTFCLACTSTLLALKLAAEGKPRLATPPASFHFA